MSGTTVHGPDQAMVKVRDLLNVPSLGLRLMAAPAAADNSIRWAHPTELLDPRPYLVGGELVLTVGSSLQDDASCHAFVRHLMSAGASALAYGVGDVTDEIPQTLIDECRAHQLPLLHVPSSVPFQLITEMVADRRAEAMAARGRRVQRLVLRLLDVIASGGDMAELRTTIDQDLGGQVSFRNGVLDWEPVLESDVRPAQDTLQHLSHVLAIRQHEEDTELAGRRREVGRLVELVLQGRADCEVLRHPLDQAGVKTDVPIVAAAWPQGAVHLLVSLQPQCLMVEFGNVTVTLTNSTEAVQAVALASRLPCGVGEPASLGDLRRVISPALAALRMARSSGAVVSYRELTTFTGLLEQLSPERLMPFAESLVSPLVHHDSKHAAALVLTLRTFLSVDGRLNDAAAALFLHSNSLRNRLKRIEELSGADPRTFEGRATLTIGLWAWDRRPSPRR